MLRLTDILSFFQRLRTPKKSRGFIGKILIRLTLKIYMILVRKKRGGGGFIGKIMLRLRIILGFLG